MFVILAALIVVPLVWMVIRRPTRAGGQRGLFNKNVIHTEPAAEQATPQAEPTVNHITPEAAKRLPPG